MAGTLADVDAPHRAARLEDWLTSRIGAVLRRRGWVPTVTGFAGYGRAPAAVGADTDDQGNGWVRTLGRVVLTRPRREGEPVDVTPDEGEALGSAAVKALRGWRSFVTVPVPGEHVTASVDGATHRLVADRGGYVDAVLPADLPAGDHDVLLAVPGSHAPEVAAPLTVIDRSVTRGIVCDIDDTVMITALPRPFIAFWNTFVLYPQARRPVPGMSTLLSTLKDQHPGSAFLYLSTGAWNVAPALQRFVARHGFPSGPMLLTDWGPTNTGWFRSGQEHKRAALARLAEELPDVAWVLVGDDGQHDPAIYGEFAHAHPQRAHAIAIRQLTPTEQVLSHGLPVPVTARAGSASTPELRGPDGLVLLRQLRGAGLL